MMKLAVDSSGCSPLLRGQDPPEVDEVSCLSPSEATPEGHYTPQPSVCSWSQLYYHYPHAHPGAASYCQANYYGHPYAYHPHNEWYYAHAPPSMPYAGPYYRQPYYPAPQPAMYQNPDSQGGLSTIGSSSVTDAPKSPGRRQGKKNRKQRRGSRCDGSCSSKESSKDDENTSLFDMKGRIVKTARDREGSNFIQRLLQVADATDMMIVFEEAMDGIDKLWNDVNGNYILQVLLDVGTEDMKDKIAQKIIDFDGGVVALSSKVYACRVIQRALETLPVDNIASIVTELKGKILPLVQCHNGNHVIQKSVTKINDILNQAPNSESKGHASLLSCLDMIIDEVSSSMKELTTHPYGCRVVQRLIEYCTGPQKMRVLDAILHENFFNAKLINHEFGNYVVQKVLAYGRPSDKAAIFGAITTNIFKLSMQKHSSNVIEMLVTHGDAKQRQEIIDEMINCNFADDDVGSKSAVVAMAGDTYGNYVVKTSLSVVEEGPQRERLFKTLLSSLEELETTPYAKKVLLQVKKYAEESGSE